MSNAIAGIGTQFRIWDGVDTWDAVAEVTVIGGPNPSCESIDVTSLDSTDGFREFIPSFKDGGEISLNLNFVKAEFDKFADNFSAQTNETFQIVFPDTGSTNFVLDGYVQDYNISTSPDDKIGLDITIKVSGAITIREGTPDDPPA